MGKLKKGVNEKAVDAKVAKESAKGAKKENDAKQQEDADWAAAGDGKLTKAQQAKEKQAAAAAEAAAKRAEAKRLAAAEEAELAKIGKKKEKPKVPQLWLCISTTKQKFAACSVSFCFCTASSGAQRGRFAVCAAARGPATAPHTGVDRTAGSAQHAPHFLSPSRIPQSG